MPRPRARLLAGAPLIDAGLIEIEESDRPFLTRDLRVPDSVTMFLLGDDRPDELLLPLLGDSGPAAGGDPVALARALRAGSRLAYLREARDGSAAGLGRRRVRRGLGSCGGARPAAGWRPTPMSPRAATCAGREARLRGAGLVAGPLDVLVARGPAAVRAFAELGWPTVLYGTCSWNPSHSRGVPVLVDVGLATPDERAAWWRASLEHANANGLDAAAETAQFRLSPQQIARAALAAQQQAALRGEPVTASDLRAGARAQNASELERCARRVAPVVDFEDLVLPGEQVARPARARRTRASPRARARRVGPRQPLVEGPGHHRAVRRRLGHGEDDVGRGRRG